MVCRSDRRWKEGRKRTPGFVGAREDIRMRAQNKIEGLYIVRVATWPTPFK